MLSPEEMRMDYVGKAEGLTLVVPVGKYGDWFLVTTADATPAAIFLEGDQRFVAIDCSDNTNYKGLLIPNVRIEVDETSVYDAVSNYPPPGMIVRKNDGLFVGASGRPHGDAERSFCRAARTGCKRRQPFRRLQQMADRAGKRTPPAHTQDHRPHAEIKVSCRLLC